MSYQKESISLGKVIATAGVLVALLGGIGSFSYAKFSKVMRDGIGVKKTPDPVATVPSVPPVQLVNESVPVAEPAKPVVETPPIPVTTGMPFAYQDQLLALFPGAVLNPVTGTIQLFEKVSLQEMSATEYVLTLPTGESVYIYHIKKTNDSQKPFAIIQAAISNNSDPKVIITDTTMSQKPAFYYNHLDKAANVRIVIEHKNGEVYAFDYPKGYHQTFKTFFQAL